MPTNGDNAVAGAAASADAALPPALRPHAAKVISAAEAAGKVRHGDQVFVGGACATPRTLVRALEALPVPPTDVVLLHFLTDGAVPHDAAGECTSSYRHRCWFVGADMRAAVRQGRAEYVPMSLVRLPQLLAMGRERVDVAFIQVSLPDEFGYVSLGVSVDVLPAVVAAARLVIAEVNPAMPRSMGDSTLHVDELHHLVPVDTPVIEYRHLEVAGDIVQAIARYIDGVIEDGSTLQVGMGRITHEALRRLAERRDLGVHSDVVTDAIVPLLEKGMLTGRAKSRQRGKIVTSFAMGTKRLYDLIDRNPLFVFQPIEVVADPATIAAQHKMVSVTQAFAIDRGGQVCVDQLDGQTYGGLAAQAEFLEGASRSPGGKAIICLASTSADGSRSNIRAKFEPGEVATIARSDVHYVITEYGIAYLFGRSMRERAAALIELAHPRFREQLLEAAKAQGLLPADQLLKNLRAYPLHDEAVIKLKDSRQVLVRPARATDDVLLRTLFHQLPERDVYTRFFRMIRGLTNRDVQRLCNLNHESEVAFVADAGTREHPQVVAHGCYFVQADTGIAETAFMIHPQWQGCGLGSALQRHMQAHAQGRGMKGFVAEILATNAAMIELARRCRGEISVAEEGEAVRVTALFS